jgi:hypothetical protein
MIGYTTPGYRVDPSDGCKRFMLRKCLCELLIVSIETSLLLALVAFAGMLSVPDPEPLRHVDSVRPKAPVLPVAAHGFNHRLQPLFMQVIRRPFE